MAAVASVIGASAAAAAAQSYQPPFVFLSGSETAVVDVSSFASRAERWNDARTRHRDDAIERAEALAAMQRRVEAQEAEEAAAEEVEAEEADPPAPPAPAPAPAPAPVPAPAALAADEALDGYEYFGMLPPADGPSPEQWLAMRHCESRHNYRAVSRSGAYRGAWQFSRTTWDWVAEKKGHDYLIGMDPIDASPAEQDFMAYELYDINGDKPWPVCGRHLR